jgi:hypothetical protein
MRPELLAEVREWLQRAMEDLREAEHDLVASDRPRALRGYPRPPARRGASVR